MVSGVVVAGIVVVVVSDAWLLRLRCGPIRFRLKLLFLWPILMIEVSSLLSLSIEASEAEVLASIVTAAFFNKLNITKI